MVRVECCQYKVCLSVWFGHSSYTCVCGLIWRVHIVDMPWQSSVAFVWDGVAVGWTGKDGVYRSRSTRISYVVLQICVIMCFCLNLRACVQCVVCLVVELCRVHCCRFDLELCSNSMYRYNCFDDGTKPHRMLVSIAITYIWREHRDHQSTDYYVFIIILNLKTNDIWIYILQQQKTNLWVHPVLAWNAANYCRAHQQYEST